MLKYVATMVTAVTVMISSVPVNAEPEQPRVKNQSTAWARRVSQIRIDDGHKLAVSSLAPAKRTYHLSLEEQAALRRALMRSVRIIA
jgi:hypothetical protein